MLVEDAVIQNKAALDCKVQVTGGGGQPGSEGAIMLHVQPRVLAQAQPHNVVDVVVQPVVGLLLICRGGVALQAAQHSTLQ